MKNILILITFFFLSQSAKAQSRLDSLWSVWVDATAVDTVRLYALSQFIRLEYLDKQPDSVMHYAQIQNDFAIEKGEKRFSADALDLKAYAHKNIGNLSVAKDYFQESYKLYEVLLDRSKKAETLYSIGGVHWLDGKYEKAIEYRKLSMAIAEEIGDQKLFAKCLRGIAHTHFQQGQFATAMKLVEQSLKISETIEDDYGIAWCINAMGVFYSKQGNKERQLEYYLKGLKLNEKVNDSISITFSLRYIADTYSEFGNDEKAMEYSKRAIAISEKLKDKRSIVFSLNSLGRCYSNQGNRREAMECFQRSLSLSIETGDKDMICQGLLNVGLLHKEKKYYSLSIMECYKSNIIAIEVGSVDAQRDACKCLYESNKALGKYAKALTYHEKVMVLEDSINYESLTISLQEMEFGKQLLIDSLRQSKEKMVLENFHQKELRKKDNTRNIFIISGLFLLFLAGGLWARIRLVRIANAKLQIAKDRAENSENIKQQFLANMSHEIRTPMNAIKGMSDILIRRNPQKDQMKYLNGIKDSSNSLLVIINDILDISKMEAGKVELEHVPFSVSEVIHNVNLIMQFKSEEKGLEMKLNIQDDIPEVLGDAVRLHQIILNLVGNAIKFTEKGVVTTSLRSEPSENAKIANLHFTISDTGIGIHEDHLEKVFNSFEQAYSDTTRKFGGTGLGLSISKKMIDLQKGKIWVESKKGKGSQFHFIIPYELSSGKEGPIRSTDHYDINSIRAELKGIKVLLVEDNAFNALVAKEELEDAIEDIILIVAENGVIAVEQIKHNAFDIVLMDVQMPVMNGYEATNIIREMDDEKSTIPIIAMTANVLKEAVDQCDAAGMNDFIGKPFDIEALIQKIYSLTKT